MNNYFDFYKSMYDNQRKMMEDLKKFTPQGIPSNFSPADLMKQYEEFMKNSQEALGNVNKFWEGLPKFGSNPFEAWQKMLADFNPMDFSKKFGLEESKVFEKMLNANKFYLSMYNFYDDLKNHYVSPALNEMEKLTQESIENFDNMFRESMLPLLPNELRPMFENPYNLTKTVVEVTSNFYEPWKESLPELSESLLKAPLSKEELTNFVNIWRENYNQTIGALLNTPAAGINREYIEQQRKAVDAAADMLLTSVEFMGQISNVTGLQGKLSMEEWLKELQESAEPKTFKEFYDYWTKKIEDELVKFFYTDEYAQLLGRIVEASARYKVESNKLAERYFADTVLVTKGQIDSLYETVYKLKKELRALKKEQATKEVKETVEEKATK